MSALQKSILKKQLPPKMPKTWGSAKLAPFGVSRRKDYTPVSWRQYFARCVDVETEGGVFRAYLSPEPSQASRPRIVTLHGGGYSGLSWALFTEEVTNMIDCQVISLDLRGHGETKANNPHDLNADTLVKDVEQVVLKLLGDSARLVLVGHSMGGAVAVRAAHTDTLAPLVDALAVIDVVEGTAMEALASMQSFLRSRPTHFRSIEHAIEWCVRSGQVRNVDSAKVSMPSQIINCSTGVLATQEVVACASRAQGEPVQPQPTRHEPRSDCIAEEDESQEQPAPVTQPQPPAPVGPIGDSNMKYKWRIDLSLTEHHWAGWFSGLSELFLTTRAPKLLLLASIEQLDKELMVGQMQGKFQMQVLTRCGHAVHEDTPGDVAQAIAGFLLRHRLTEPTVQGEHLQYHTPRPGC